jgi:cystathionine beta-lyase/cystathionine gamma-synthase
MVDTRRTRVMPHVHLVYKHKYDQDQQKRAMEKAVERATKEANEQIKKARLANRTKELFEEKMKKWREARAAAKGGRTRRGRKSRSTRRR